MAPLTRRSFLTLAGGTVAGAAAAPLVGRALTSGSAAGAAAATDPYAQKFLDQYAKIKDPANGYFSPAGLPYHSIETLMVEAPDHGHESTSEAFSYWFWLEAAYGRVTGDWTNFNNAWAAAETSIIPQHVDQPTNSGYNPSKPATYAPEWPDPSKYPSALDTSISVGQDPIAQELQSAWGTPDIYGMHWLMDLDNVYGYGNKCGTGSESGPTATGPGFINTYQRGSQESVWETIPQPCTDLMKYGGKNGYLDLFVGDSSYAQQWKYTNAPDADARAIQAAYWALTWATAQGKASDVSATAAKAARMGDYLRYAMFDKYFKQIGNCVGASACPAGSNRSSQHYLLGWYYAWGGSVGSGGAWAWRIGDGAAHHGYQNPVAAYALSTVSAMKPKGATAVSDWTTSLQRQKEFLTWLQSPAGAIAGGATNSWDGQYGTPPPEDSNTFYGMFYDWEPVYHDPPSNNWVGMQGWGMERWMEYYYITKDASIKPVLDKWVGWISPLITANPSTGDFSIPSTLNWTGQPDTWNKANPGANAGLSVSVVDSGQDVGVAAALIKALLYYAKATGDTASHDLGKNLLDAVAMHTEPKGITVPETRSDYNRFNGSVYVPPGWTGTMPNGDTITAPATFISIRSFYKQDKDWPKVQAYLDGGAVPTFTYHRFWAQSDLALAFSTYAELFPSTGGGGPSTPTGLTVSGTTATSVSLTWTASTGGTAPLTYQVSRDGTVVSPATLSTTSFTDTGLTSGTQYTYTVTAKDAAGLTSAASAPVTATPGNSDTTAPTVPAGLGVVGTTATSVSLHWDPSSDPDDAVAKYQVFRDGGSTPVASPISTSFTDTGLTTGQQYTYTVKAVDTHGNASAASDPVSATPNGGGTAPTAPSLLGVMSASASGGVQLVWDPSSGGVGGVAHYSVKRDGTQIATPTDRTYTDKTVVAGQSYSYQVTAVDTAGNESAPSNAVTATIPGVVNNGPNPPSNLAASVSGTTVSLTWTASSTAGVSYRVLRDNTQVTTSTTTSATDSNVPVGDHIYTVVAVNASGTSAPSNQAPVTIIKPQGGGCSATYHIDSDWGSAFNVTVTVTAGTTATTGWKVSWTFPGGQQISQMWNATPSGSGTVTATNMNYNGALQPGQSTQFGFQASPGGSGNTAPTPTCTAS